MADTRHTPDPMVEAVEYLLLHLAANTSLESVEKKCVGFRERLRADYAEYFPPIAPTPPEGSNADQSATSEQPLPTCPNCVSGTVGRHSNDCRALRDF